MNIDGQFKEDSSHKHHLVMSPDQDKNLDATGRNATFTNHKPSLNSDLDRVRELEAENVRLRQLVGELLVKNQQAREQSPVSRPLASNERSTASPAWDKRDAARLFS